MANRVDAAEKSVKNTAPDHLRDRAARVPEPRLELPNRHDPVLTLRQLSQVQPTRLSFVPHTETKLNHPPVSPPYRDGLGVWRSRIAAKSTPAGRVPKAWPQSPLRREAQKASATAGSP